MATTLRSPGIAIKEIDLSGVVPSTQSTAGAIVGNFQWGPAKERVLIGNETSLAATFGTPSSTNAVSYLSAAYFLKYSGNLYVTREVTAAAYNANANTDSSGVTVTVLNDEDWETDKSGYSGDSGDTDTGAWIARYPGSLGNSLKVSFCPQAGSFSSWDYEDEFDRAPGTSNWASTRGDSNDEIHIVVVDADGGITGTPGTVLEKFAHLSVATGATTTDGSNNNFGDVINNASSWIRFAYVDTGRLPMGSSFNTASTGSKDFMSGVTWTNGTASVTLVDGADSGALTTSEYATGYDLYEDKDTVEIDFLIAPSLSATADQVTVTNDLIASAIARKDCVVVSSPNRAAVVNNGSSTNADIVTHYSSVTFSSYHVADNNYLKVYDKYNDQYVFIPAASSTAGIMALTEITRDAFFSPAGARRGAYLGITGLAYYPTQTERDTLYKASINPIANIPGQGVLLFGDKTHMNRPSAFDRINVRRLFLLIERAISLAARNVMFEFNDEFTRAEFTNIVEPFLRDIQGRRGITDFRVVCDETNNTDVIVDNNEFQADIFVKPARSINFVTLNFVAVRSGVSFEEVVGTV